MKINSTNAYPELQPTDAQRPKGSAAEEARETPGAPDPDDATTLASSQHTVQSLAARLANVPEIRQQKVTALRQAVQNGRYRVSDQQIAQAVYTVMLGPNAGGRK